MKVPRQQKLQQISFNCSLYIGYENSDNFYEKCTATPHYFLVADTTLALDNPLLFRKNILETI